MEEASTNQYSANLAGNNAGKPEEQFVRPQYNMPGILQFLQTEWAKFEMERAQWDVERAELQVNYYFSLLLLVLTLYTFVYCIAL